MTPKGKNQLLVTILILLLLCIAVFIISLLANYTNQMTNKGKNSAPQTAAVVINSSAIALMAKQTGYCKALAPKDWAFTSNSLSTGADLYAPDKKIHAGWGITPVIMGDNPPYQFSSVDSFLMYWLGYVFTGKFTGNAITLADQSESLLSGFTQREFTSTTGKSGAVIYKTYNFGSPTYVISIYEADTPTSSWTTQGAAAFYSAISIRCVSQARLDTSNVNYRNSDPSNVVDNPELDLSDKWTEMIMGYENVYSPSTGEHYEVPINSYWEGGPNGGGYYRTLPGGGYEKLLNGFGYY